MNDSLDLSRLLRSFYTLVFFDIVNKAIAILVDASFIITLSVINKLRLDFVCVL